MPSIRLITAPCTSAKATRLTNVATNASRTAVRAQPMTGAITAAKPKMSRILAMFDPTTLPKAISDAPSRAALTDTSNSGVEVPKPTITNPINSLETPIRSAIATAPRTRASPPTNKRTRPAATRTRSCNIWNPDLPCSSRRLPGHNVGAPKGPQTKREGVAQNFDVYSSSFATRQRAAIEFGRAASDMSPGTVRGAE